MALFESQWQHLEPQEPRGDRYSHDIATPAPKVTSAMGRLCPVGSSQLETPRGHVTRSFMSQHVSTCLHFGVKCMETLVFTSILRPTCCMNVCQRYCFVFLFSNLRVSFRRAKKKGRRIERARIERGAGGRPLGTTSIIDPGH